MKETLTRNPRVEQKEKILSELLFNLEESVLKSWYPVSVDKEYGGYFSNLSYNWEVLPCKEKMIVTQARHIWTCSKAASFLNKENYKDIAWHGYRFLKNKMWDSEFGGFYQMRSREGNLTDANGYFDEKRTYGNAYSVYCLAALYQLTELEEVLGFAKDTFNWIETHSADPEYNGYFQFLTRENKPFDKNSGYKTKASDNIEVGYKDQNSSIHLLEAYTELYNVWKSHEVYERLKNILFLIRDVMTTEKGYLTLFFDRQLNPVSFRNEPAGTREKNYGLDHVSFGHDYETAFLMLEASYALGLENDKATLTKAKMMLDHAIDNGWDNNSSGFFDEGYYFKEDGKCEIIKDTKVWWAQAEGLNALLLFSKIFPEEKRYHDLFVQLWDYIQKYLIDHEYGDWYWGSLEKEPHYRTEPKASIWKCTYHTGRALMNCIKMLADENFSLMNNERFRKEKNHFDEFIRHWRSTAG
ncbi:MAG: AGE family epimerase/isomerase, partial [Ignavibacteriaceae bacterium]